MGKVSNVVFFASLITLFSPILCRSSHQDNHHDTNWISYLPGIGHFMKNFTLDDSTVDQQITGKALDYKGENVVSESTESSTPEVLMNGDTYYDYNNSSRGVVVGVPIGGIILFILICYCCYRCCCRPRVVVQGATIIRAPPPPSQPQTQAPIVIHNVAPQQYPPQQYPPPYPTNYEMGHPPQPMKQWNQVNQHSPPPQQYYGDQNAPPQYGRY